MMTIAAFVEPPDVWETIMSKKSSRSRPTIEEVINSLRSNMPDLKECFGVKSLGVFGSYVRGETRRRSDLDLLVEFHWVPIMFEFVRLARHLAKLLGVKVDLVMKTALKPAIGERILAEVVPG